MILVQGCSLTNPNVTWDGPNTTDGVVTLRDAMDYADNGIKKYREAIGEHSELRSYTGIGLIPITAAAAGLGITGVSPEAVTALGLTAASGYSISVWLDSKPRQRIYILGINALSCAKTAMAPLDFSTSEYGTLIDDLKSLNGRITAVQMAIGTVRSLIPSSDGGQAARDADTAETIAQGAEEVYETGIALKLNILRAGNYLEDAVNKISAQVDNGLIDNVSSLSALPGILGTLAQTATQFTSISKPAKTAKDLGGAPAADGVTTKESITQAAIDLAASLNDLKNSVGKLTAITRKITVLVESVNKGKSIETLKKCGADVSKLQISLTVDRTVIKFEHGKGNTEEVVVSEGKTPYAAQLVGDAVVGLSVKMLGLGGPIVEIKTTDKTPAKEYSVRISDAVPTVIYVRIKVEPKPAENDKKDKKGKQKEGFPDELTKDEAGAVLKVFGLIPRLEDIVSKEPKPATAAKDEWRKAMKKYVHEIQAALGFRAKKRGGFFKIDGNFGTDTRKAIKPDGTNVGLITEEYLNGLLRNPKTEGLDYTEFEQAIVKDADKFESLKQKAGISGDDNKGQIREKIAEYRGTLGFPMTHYFTPLLLMAEEIELPAGDW